MGSFSFGSSCKLSYWFWHVSQHRISQSRVISVLIQTNCFHFPLLRQSGNPLLEDSSFAFKHFALFLPTWEGAVISFILKSAMLTNWAWPPRPIAIYEWPVDPLWPSHLKCLLKCSFVGLGISWHMLKFSEPLPRAPYFQCQLVSEIYCCNLIFNLKKIRYWSTNPQFCQHLILHLWVSVWEYVWSVAPFACSCSHWGPWIQCSGYLYWIFAHALLIHTLLYLLVLSFICTTVSMPA